MVAESAILIRRWFEEVWNQGREQTIDAMCAKDAIGYGQAQRGAKSQGPEHFKQFWRGLRGAFSDIHVDIHETIEQQEGRRPLDHYYDSHRTVSGNCGNQ